MRDEITQLQSLWRWIRAHKFDRRWLAIGWAFVIIGAVFLAKGPVTWFMEWLEEGRAMRNEESTKVWDIHGEIEK